jgi:hypothetical protein
VQLTSGQSFCTKCDAGSFANGSACERCEGGRFQNDTGQDSCIACDSLACAAGARQGCGGASAGFCNACTPGSFVNASAAKCEPCAAQTFSAEKNQDTCEPCPAGKFQDALGQPYCAMKQPCVPGKFEANETDSSSNRCESCDPGHISFRTNAPTCIACANGQYTAEVPRIICAPCPPGHFGSGKVSKGSAQHCRPCAPGQFQPLQGKSTCRKCRDDHACPRNSTYQQACRGNEFVVKEEQKCRACPRLGPDGEAECKGGRLVMNDGFFSDAALRSGAAQGNGTAVNGLTIFTKCPCSACCGVDNYTGATQCRLGTTGTLCAVCKAGYHRQKGGSCVPCPQTRFADYMQAEASQFITIALLMLLAVALLAMDARAEWRHCRWIQRHLQGVYDKFVNMTKILVGFGQFITLAGPVYTINWPPVFHNFLSGLPQFNLDFFRFVPFE